MSPLRATTRRRVQGLPKKSTMPFASSPCKWMVCCGERGRRERASTVDREEPCVYWLYGVGTQAEEGSAPPPPTLSRYALTTRCARVMSDRVCVHVCCIYVHECVSANVCRF